MASHRDNFPKPVIRKLAERVSYLCSCPDCRKPTLGPSSDPNAAVNLGRAAHITAAAKGGPRHDPTLSTTQRRSIQNGIWLCPTHADLVDKDEAAYPVTLLQQWKTQAEEQAAAEAFIRSLPERRAIPEEPIPRVVQVERDKAKALVDADKYGDAIPILQRALVLADESGHTPAKVKVRCQLAHALFEAREDFHAAERHFRDALGMVPSGDLCLKHNVLHGLGDMQFFAGRLVEAKAIMEAGWKVAIETARADHLAPSLISLSLIEGILGFSSVANAKLDQAIQVLLQRELTLPPVKDRDHAHMLAVCYMNKAKLCRDDGNVDMALTLYAKAEDCYRMSPDKLDVGKARLFCGETHCSNADWQKGVECFKGALELFHEAENPMWSARALERIARLWATHENWEEALRAGMAAVAGAKEANHPEDQVHYLRFAASVLEHWKKDIGRQTVTKLIHDSCRGLRAEEQSEALARLADQISQISKAIDEAVANDQQVRELRDEARQIADDEQLQEEIADCILEQAFDFTPSEDDQTRNGLVSDALAILKKLLGESDLPKRRGHLMGRISSLYRHMGQREESFQWLKRAGQVFEKAGDAFGLANYYGALAEHYREAGSLDEEIAAYRLALAATEGRCFHHVAAGTRVNLAHALRLHGQCEEALVLLEQAETICERHRLKDIVDAIARNRSDIEKELQSSRPPAHTLTELLLSLDQLRKYRPDLAASYLPFWYFTWNTQLLAVLRSGQSLSLMMITDDVPQFMRFAETYQHLADHFLMTTTKEPSIKVNPVLPIPPTWLYPATFTFVGVRRKAVPVRAEGEQEDQEEELEEPPRYKLTGPARMFPLYMHIAIQGDSGYSTVSAFHAPFLPQEAIDLMAGTPIDTLIERRTVWIPTDRCTSKDAFLTDLRIGHERGVFPVYLGTLPVSEAVSMLGSVEVCLPANVRDATIVGRWKRSLVKLAKMNVPDAEVALLELPDLFPATSNCSPSLRFIVYLLAFKQMGRQVFHPALVIPR